MRDSFGRLWHRLFAEGQVEFDLPEDLQFRKLDGRIVLRLMLYVKPYARQMLLALLMMAIVTLTSLAGPYLVKLALDNAIAHGDIPLLRWLMVAWVAVNAVQWAARSAQVAASVGGGQSSIYQLRRDLFAHLQRQSMSFYDHADIGVLTSRLTSDVNQLQELVTWAVTGVAADFLTLIGIVVVMLSLDARLSLITFSVIPIMLLLTAVWRGRARDNWRRVRFYNGRMLGYIEENIQGVRVVQAFTREVLNHKRFVEQVNFRFTDAQARAARLSALFFPGVDFLGSAAVALAIGFGGSVALAQASGLPADGPGVTSAITPGVLVAFVLYIGRFFDPIRDLAERYNTLQAAMAAGERLFGLLDRPVAICSRPGAPELPVIQGEVRFEHVDFAYSPDVPVLKDIDLEVTAGQLVALVGATGSGKSSLVKLLNRSYDISSGRLLIDGQDVREVDLASLRRQMGIVLQETFLFRGTVADNIRYGCLNASDEEIVEAARAIGAHEFIERMPLGYDTQVEEGGAVLSVGQRQLLAFARALLANPRILILDEATSSIDTQTEKIIQSAMDRLLQGRTAFVIAHRLSTIVRADQIVVLQNGRILEHGTHEELLARHGAYHHLYTMGFTAVRLEETA